MKKLCLLIALALALACVPALAAEGDMILGREEDDTIYFNRIFSDGETLYLPTYGILYTWRPGETELTEHAMRLEAVDENTDLSLAPFACDGELYAIGLKSSYRDYSSFEGAALYALSFGEDGGVEMEEKTPVEWDDMVEYYDQESYAIQPDDIVAMSGKAYIRHYNSQYDYVISVMDMATGHVEELDAVKDAFTMAAYKDGTLLVEQYSYAQSDVARLMVYDPADESVTQLAELQISEYSPLNGLAYDFEGDVIYCLKGGEVCPIDLESGAVGEGVTEMPLESYGGNVACVLSGGYYAFATEGVAIRNLDPGQRAEIRLKLVDSAYSEAVTNAYARFSNANGDVSLVLSRDYGEAQNLIERMMNRDDSVDIYTLSTNSAIYDALYRRGYLMELDGCEAVSELAANMYPSLRESLSVDGHLVALPLEVYSWAMGFNEKALEALGLSLSDVPDNWSDFLDFLPTLEGPLSENKGVSLSYYGQSASEMRNDLFYTLFDCYQRYVNAVEPTMGYDTPLLRGLIEKLDAIDFVALGCLEDPEDEDEEQGRVIRYSDDEMTLLQTSVGCTIGNFYSDYTPILMGLDAQTRPPMVLETTVAFVNPFTKHPETALAFMDTLAQTLPNSVRYCLDPSLNEPVRGKNNEGYLLDAQKSLEDLKAQLENAEPADVQMLEESVASTEEMLEYIDKNAWDVSKEALEWYRANAEDAVVSSVNWLYADESGEAWELMSQYRQGTIGLDEMLKGIDRKVQMMLLEGN